MPNGFSIRLASQAHGLWVCIKALLHQEMLMPPIVEPAALAPSCTSI